MAKQRSGKGRKSRVKGRGSAGGGRRRKEILVKSKAPAITGNSFFGIPLDLCLKQPKFEPGEKLFCPQTGLMCDVLDAHDHAEGFEPGEAQVYMCMTKMLICGYKGHKIVHLFDFMPLPLRANIVLEELYGLFRPVAEMAKDKDKQFKDAGLLPTGEELISVAVPLPMARKVHFLLSKAYNILREQEYPIDGPALEEDMVVPSNFAHRHLHGVPQ